jgi:hypothetical protein
MVGESTIWTGSFVASGHALNTTPLYPSWFGYLTNISPLFTYLILTRVESFEHICLSQVTGIPPLEKQMDKKYGDTAIMKNINARYLFCSKTVEMDIDYTSRQRSLAKEAYSL